MNSTTYFLSNYKYLHMILKSTKDIFSSWSQKVWVTHKQDIILFLFCKHNTVCLLWYAKHFTICKLNIYFHNMQNTEGMFSSFFTESASNTQKGHTLCVCVLLKTLQTKGSAWPSLQSYFYFPLGTYTEKKQPTISELWVGLFQNPR